MRISEVTGLGGEHISAIHYAVEKYKKSNFGIFRGSTKYQHANILIRDPSVLTTRRPATSSSGLSIMNTILDGHPEWKDYPSRDKAIIGYSNRRISYDYSNGEDYNIMAVCPIGNPKIGVCPGSDFWDCFPIFIPTLYRLFLFIDDPRADVSTLNAMNYDELMNFLDTITLDNIGSVNSEILDSLRQFKTLKNVVLNLLGAKRNKFGLIDWTQYGAEGNREVWFSGPAVLVKLKTFMLLVDGKLEISNLQD